MNHESDRKLHPVVGVGLTDGTLEEAVIEQMLSQLRDTEGRKNMRKELRCSDEAIERALVSPAGRRRLETAMAAYLMERAPVVVCKVVALAETGEAWAGKAVLDLAALGEHLRMGEKEEEPDESEVLISSDFDRGLFENVREILQGKTREKTPGTDDRNV